MSKKGQSKSGGCGMGTGAGVVELLTPRAGKTREGEIRLGKEQRQAWPEASEGQGLNGQLRTGCSERFRATWDSGCQAPALQTADPVIFRTAEQWLCDHANPGLLLFLLPVYRNSFLPKGSNSGHQAPQMLAFI